MWMPSPKSQQHIVVSQQKYCSLFRIQNVKQYRYCYESYVKLQLEYASTVWSSYTEENIDKLEMVQRNAAKYVLQDFSRYSSPTAMMSQLEWMTPGPRGTSARGLAPCEDPAGRGFSVGNCARQRFWHATRTFLGPRNVVCWLLGKSLKLLPPYVIF